MRYLNLNEEREVLKKLKDLPILGNGASRIVFADGDREIEKMLGVSFPSAYVIKLIVGAGGFNQKNFEVSAYLNNDDYNHLAIIYGVGQYIEIMEYCDADGDDYRDLFDELDGCSMDDYEDFREVVFDYWCEEDDGSREDEVRQLYEAYEELTNINGYTADNGQLAWTDDGRLVAYDYGYNTEEGDHESMVSGSTYDLSDYPRLLDFYINSLIELNEVTEEVLDRLDTLMVSKVTSHEGIDEEEDICGYEDEEEEEEVEEPSKSFYRLSNIERFMSNNWVVVFNKGNHNCFSKLGYLDYQDNVIASTVKDVPYYQKYIDEA